MDVGSGFAGGVLPALAPNRSRWRHEAARPGFDHLAWPFCLVALITRGLSVVTSTFVPTDKL
jgi:hypothetical protein